MNKKRKIHAAKKEWPCVTQENFDFWVKHRPHLKYFFNSREKIDKNELIQFIETIYQNQFKETDENKID